MAIRVGERIGRPSDLERFLTARWGLHAAWYGRRLCYLPNQHPPWPLHRAVLLRLAEGLIAAAGLPPPAGGPVSVLYSPGVPVRLGIPQPPQCPRSAGSSSASANWKNCACRSAPIWTKATWVKPASA
jgi:hypothetical protein